MVVVLRLKIFISLELYLDRLILILRLRCTGMQPS
jgi:hypothetical protein